jgi:prolyl oligopeptidase
MRTILRFAAAFTLVAATACTPSIPPPPNTPKDATVDTVQGVKIADPYRWLENWSDPKVQAWSEAQNARTRTYLDALKSQAPIKSELMKLVTATSPSYFGLSAKGACVFAFYSDPQKQQPMMVALNRRPIRPAARSCSIPTPSTQRHIPRSTGSCLGRRNEGCGFAVEERQRGRNAARLSMWPRARRSARRSRACNIRRPAAAWPGRRTATGFWYTRYPGPEAPKADQHFNMQVYFHKLGAEWKNDPLVLGNKDGLEKVSEVFLDNRFNLPTVMAMVQRGDGNVWAFYVLKQGRAGSRRHL